MSKNIFSVLVNEDSDEDRPKPKAVQPPPPVLPNKEVQERDRQVRENVGDYVQKDATSHKRSDNPPKNKGDYASGERRQFDRHSGTGRPAFGQGPKKDGHGYGNVGKSPNESETKPDQTREEPAPESQVPRAPEEPEEIITADEFIKKTKLNYDFLKQEEQVTNTKAPVVTDPNLKVMSHRTKDEPHHSKKAKNLDSLMQGSKNLAEGQIQPGQWAQGRRRPSPQQKKRIDYNEENFPSLS